MEVAAACWLEKFNPSDPSYTKEKAQAAFLRDGAIILTGVHNILSKNDRNSDPLEGNDDDSACRWSAAAALVPGLVWDGSGGGVGGGDLLLSDRHRADAVHEEHRQLKLEGDPLLPHSDGYIWGDAYPDVVILLCQQPAVQGNGGGGDASGSSSKNGKDGASYLIDGEAVVQQGRWLSESTRRVLETALVDHTERGGEQSYARGAESIVPVLRRLPAKGWRWRRWQQNKMKQPGTELADKDEDIRNLCWRRMISKEAARLHSDREARGRRQRMFSAGGSTPDDDDTADLKDVYLSLWCPLPPPSTSCPGAADAATVEEEKKEEETAIWSALRELDRAIAAEQLVAPRFVLQRGEALVVDNFRMLHARDAYYKEDGSAGVNGDYDGGTGGAAEDDENVSNSSGDSKPKEQKQRLMWRVWAWTDASHGLPPEMEVAATGSTVEAATSSVLEAEKVLSGRAETA